MIRLRHFLQVACGFLACIACGVADAAESASVFDLRLNEPFDVRECAYTIATVPFGQQGILVKRTVRMYRYTESRPAAGRCFQREGFGYTREPVDFNGKALPLPPAGPLVNGDVRIIYADSSRPSLIGDKWVWVRVMDSKLQTVKFYFPSRSIREVELALGEKYGNPTNVEDMYVDRYEAGRKEFYIARWELPDLTVVLTSVDTSQDYAGGRYSAGHVVVSYGPRVRKEDKNPL
jgi:hypothetical protein